MAAAREIAMNTADYVNDAMAPFATYEERHGAVAVTTSCLYPSNAMVTVFVRGGPNGAIVSDDGRAIDELTALNREIPNADKFLYRFCRQTGLKAQKGRIVSPKITGNQLVATIAFVANASASAAAWGVEKFKLRRRRNLRKELEKLLNQSFSRTQIQKKRYIQGKSTRPYCFHNVVRLDGRVLLIDPVIPDPNSINSHAIAHLDVSQRRDETIIQRLVFDDEEKWNAADLNLLQMAATLVPLSGLDETVRGFSSMP